MYNPLFFEMMSGSIAAERVAAAERHRTTRALAAECATGWVTRSSRLLLSMLARGLSRVTCRPGAPAQRGNGRPPSVRLGATASSAAQVRLRYGCYQHSP
jgi:hypothetical protein